ncbi:hypothetical protein FDUTEX481_00749 [Tolypothrix sp. PCC 7601]|nr:hypothetical protein FDUTEX481_00749 [Tolypothrix sp. PCC 7601]
MKILNRAVLGVVLILSDRSANASGKSTSPQKPNQLCELS